MESPQNSGPQNPNMAQDQHWQSTKRKGHSKKFSRPGEIVPGMCARVRYWILKWFMRKQNFKGN